jgi:hypothetical protein
MYGRRRVGECESIPQHRRSKHQSKEKRRGEERRKEPEGRRRELWDLAKQIEKDTDAELHVTARN